mmetsp:Transcript_9972/g.21294  ORF Transcript_9972/g.21294 Transcript_9972/m.21294 type:complete len:599 (+) Transcript_9972:309-2105(+)|eukprot:CAMPEP_0202899342 /NCGR_PEP_ID=MMETSP1392-20130828/7601_1 /ASSEMBLY_ACC=CAM_ASM_000868 /TAXON_ID=225041 /ORGANISM="Chlamydomonas chlamydogama, Strain SAG 11-48b" /LENGTH=598 /DNA_ID=CAMNT_0049585505 /DNA_START=247 /DNA_END=2043 /DNA_ORIENTATION=+
MNSLLLRNLSQVPKSPSLRAFSEYREEESTNYQQSSVTDTGVLLEYETLELRVHPPNVEIDNDTFDDRTLLTLDSANRPGTLVELVQCLTELGLNVRKARISSDGGWFIDQFEVTDNNRKVTNERKLQVIRHVLSVDQPPQGQQQPTLQHPRVASSTDDLASKELGATDQADEARQLSTVFELAGTDRVGLLADVVSLLKNNGCSVRSAAVWTYNSRVAFVVSVLERNQPIKDGVKLQRLKQLLGQMMDTAGDHIVRVSVVKGLLHYERRLHQLLLKEEEAVWRKSNLLEKYNQLVLSEQCSTALPVCSSNSVSGPNSSFVSGSSTPTGAPSSRFTLLSNLQLAVGSALGMGLVPSAPSQVPTLISPKASQPEVVITSYKHRNYWAVNIRCKDRKKLFFDTVCTLADLAFDVYHAAVDTEGDVASQVFYVRPRYGDATWDSQKAAKLKYCLEMAIMRRFPKGLKIHVTTYDGYDIGIITQVFRDANLWITRAKVRPFTSGHTFYLLDGKTGGPPDLQTVQTACQSIGGRLLNGDKLPPSAAGSQNGKKPGPAAAAAAAAAANNAAIAAGNGNGAYKFGFAVLMREATGNSPSSITSSI